MEWPPGQKSTTDFTATTLPANMSRRELVWRVKQPWRAERVYEETIQINTLKGVQQFLLPQ